LELGADPDRRDAWYDSTALGWARHLGHEEVIRFISEAGGR
jgi:hypothetical protein